jgi:type IV pilus biogenesis protein CpaD/CtpE
MSNFFDVQHEQGVIDNETREEVLDLWRRRAKKIGGIPKF